MFGRTPSGSGGTPSPSKCGSPPPLIEQKPGVVTQLDQFAADFVDGEKPFERFVEQRGLFGRDRVDGMTRSKSIRFQSPPRRAVALPCARSMRIRRIVSAVAAKK